MTIELIQEMKAFMRSHFDELNLFPLMQNLRAVGREREFNAYMALLNKHLGMSKDLIPFELKLQDYALADKIIYVIPIVGGIIFFWVSLTDEYNLELDTYAEVKGLDSKAIIEGVGLDSVSAHITTIHHSAMVATACRKILNSSLPTIRLFLRT